MDYYWRRCCGLMDRVRNDEIRRIGIDTDVIEMIEGKKLG